MNTPFPCIQLGIVVDFDAILLDGILYLTFVDAQGNCQARKTVSTCATMMSPEQAQYPAIVDHLICLAHRAGYCGHLFQRALKTKLANRVGIGIKAH
jgi:hypothetical protein